MQSYKIVVVDFYFIFFLANISKMLFLTSKRKKRKKKKEMIDRESNIYLKYIYIFFLSSVESFVQSRTDEGRELLFLSLYDTIKKKKCTGLLDGANLEQSFFF